MHQGLPEIHSKIVSHRLRNFDNADATIAGLRRASEALVLHMEVDARRTSDGKIVVHHDPWAETADGQFVPVVSHSLEELRAASIHPLYELHTFIDEFVRSAKPYGAHLHIDVKSREATLIIQSIVSSRLTPDDYTIVSWMPEVLKLYHKLEPNVRLCLSNVTTRRPLLYLSARGLINPWSIRMAKGLAKLALPQLVHHLNSLDIRYGRDVLRAKADGEGNTVGVFFEAPPKELSDLLKRTSGYVCLPKSLTDCRTIAAYHSLGVSVALFSFTTPQDIESCEAAADADYLYFDGAINFAKNANVPSA